MSPMITRGRLASHAFSSFKTRIPVKAVQLGAVPPSSGPNGIRTLRALRALPVRDGDKQARVESSKSCSTSSQGFELSAKGVTYLVGLMTCALSSPEVAKAVEEIEALPYNTEAGTKIFETAGGVLYTGLILFFFVRLFSKRSKFATSTRLADLRKGNFDPDMVEERWWRKERKTPITVPEVLTSAALAFVISIVLFNLSEMLQEYLDAYPVPNQMAVRNIAVALKTILQGGSYLLSFMFAANAAGLFLMGGRMVIDPVFERDVNAGVKAEGDKDAEAPASQPQSTADTKVGEEKSTDMEQETRGEGVAVKEEARMQQR